MANEYILGWDVGGAHLKTVLTDQAGNVLAACQLPCALWRGTNELDKAIDVLQGQVDLASASHAITMTGELADVFPDRKSGVREISYLLAQRLGTASFYAGRQQFVPESEVEEHADSIASANWMASAAFLASNISNALFMDIGSTTSDLVLLAKNQVQSRGLTDAERMRCDELVYTGVVRTPLMAVASRVPFDGEWVTVAAEHFATTADVYRLTGELDKRYDMADTADGKGKTVEESARRLARMIGHDYADASASRWQLLAHGFRQTQLDRLKYAALRQYSRGLLDEDAPVIGAGAGAFLVQELARQLDRPYIPASEFMSAATQSLKDEASLCFPAYAVARLTGKA